MERNITRDELQKMIRDIAGPQVGELVEGAMARSLAPLKQQHTDLLARAINGTANGHEDPDRSSRAGRVIRAYGTAAINMRRMTGPYTPADVLKAWGSTELADMVHKAMSASIAGDGGHLIPSQLSSDVIEFLRPASIVRRLGPTTIPIPNGTLRTPKVTAGSTANYQGENQNLTQTQLTVGQVVMTFKKLTALVPASNDLLRYSGPGAASADAMIRDDVVRAIAQRE